jgi:hypothetical protein
MLIAKIAKPHDPQDYREAFPNTSFVNGPDDTFLTENGYAKVSVFRDYDSKTQKLVPAEPYFENGWVYTVEVADKTAEDLAADTEAEKTKIRAQRNQMLASSDWTQLLDSPEANKATWATYRQALRDVTTQSGFPWEVTWPTEPV